MVAVKICGITRSQDAVLAAELGTRYVGLNFWPGSPRHVSVSVAKEIRCAVGSAVRVVGVFVNEAPGRVEEIAGEVGLDLLQFHGDEGPDDLQPFAGRAIKVLRSAPGLDSRSFSPYPEVFAFLIDIKDPAYGGTGKGWNYAGAAGLRTSKPVFIAGGIGPDTVRSALAAGTYGIDVCSRVEASPGAKDPALLRRLFTEIADAQTQDRS